MVSLIQSNETYDLSHSSASSHSKKGGLLERQRLAFFIGAARARQSLDRPMLGPHARWAIAGSRAAQRRPARRLHARRCRHPQRRAPSAAGCAGCRPSPGPWLHYTWRILHASSNPAKTQQTGRTARTQRIRALQTQSISVRSTQPPSHRRVWTRSIMEDDSENHYH